MKQYLLSPFGEYDLNNNIFTSPYGVLRGILGKLGINLKTIDLGDIRTADRILTFNHNETLLRQCKYLNVPPEKMVLFLYEPEVVIPKQYQPKVWKDYGMIFTYLDNLVDNYKIFKMSYPQGQHFIAHLPKFHERKFLTLINGHKYSYVNNELYSFRRKAIRYFEKYENFDLYGFGWNDKNALRLSTFLAAVTAFKPLTYIGDVIDSLWPFTNYRGSVSDKYNTLSQYKYALCFENEKNVKGWLSEKIFDCFFTGTVPIYLGASDVQDYIPTDCFIDMRQISNFKELNQLLSSTTEKTFTNWQSAGQNFIHSSAFDAWRPAAVFGEIAKKLLN